MKLVSFKKGGEAGYGAVVDGGIVHLSGRPGLPPELRDLLGDAIAMQQADTLLTTTRPDTALTDVTLLPVIPNPHKVICVGLNYVAHAAEAGRQIGQYPTIFQRYAETLVAHHEDLVCPKVSEQFDYEGELAVVIGRGGAHIAVEDAMAHVAGYTCFNDASVRDWQFHTHQYGMGKNFNGSGALGPWLVTADEIADYRKLVLKTHLNGEELQHGELHQLAFDIPFLISYISQALPWQPGDILATGTPSGIGFKRNPPIYLKPNDLIEVTISQIGTLSNRVAGEQ